MCSVDEDMSCYLGTTKRFRLYSATYSRASRIALDMDIDSNARRTTRSPNYFYELIILIRSIFCCYPQTVFIVVL